MTGTEAALIPRARLWLRRGWRAVHRIAPAAAERIDDRRRARSRQEAAVAAAVHFEERISGLERELELVAKRLAVLTMRVEQSGGATAGNTADVEERLVKARLGAISSYEERISRLEAAAGLALTRSAQPGADPVSAE